MTKTRSRRKHNTPEIKNLIIVSDMHIGSRLGLFPSGYKMPLDDGGAYTASRLQRVTWSWWKEFWNEWVPQVTRDEPYAVVLNGDIVDGGAHHGNTVHISANMEDQVELALHVLEPIAARASRLYVVRGTEVHGGISGHVEESIARQLNAAPDRDGKFSRWRLRLRLGYGLIDIAHHIGTTGSMAYETSAIHKELEQIYADAARWGEEPPDVVVRSHRHTCAETRIRIYKRRHGARAQGFATSCTTAGWQLATPFAYRVAGARRMRPQFGGTLVRCGDEEVYTRHWVRSIEPAPIEEVRL